MYFKGVKIIRHHVYCLTSTECVYFKPFLSAHLHSDEHKRAIYFLLNLSYCTLGFLPILRMTRYFFQNYQKPFRKDRPDNRFGGAIIYVKNDTPVNEERTWKWTELNLFG